MRKKSGQLKLRWTHSASEVCAHALLKAFWGTLLISAVISPVVRGQSLRSSGAPDQFEFFEGHAYMGSDTVKWKNDRLVFVKRVANMKGKGEFDETVEELNPTPEAWERFWARVDALGIWQWKSDYHDPKRDWPDMDSWALTLRHGGRQVKSKGYAAVPAAYSEFRAAVSALREEARRRERK